MDTGLLTVKRLANAKSRLSPAFDPQERTAIADALLSDSLQLCAATTGVTWWVVSDDDAVLERATSAGFGAIGDPGEGLNVALRGAIAALEDLGASSVLILPNDIPLATAEDVHDILDTGATSQVVVVPSHRDGGTNGLFLNPPGAITPRFGEASLSAHVAAAETAGVRCSMLPLERMELDIDTHDDVVRFLEIADDGATETERVLRDIEASR